MPMKHPAYPGRIVRHDCLEPLGLTVKEAAEALGVSRQALNNLANERAGVSPEMAIRLWKAFGSTPDTWVRMQAAFDLAQALRHKTKSGWSVTWRDPQPDWVGGGIRRCSSIIRKGKLPHV